jgi:outer membrane immunogenic protein
MKQLLISTIAALGLIGTPAFAADMAVKAPPAPPPAPIYSWTGWYVGGNLGVSFGHVKTDFNAAPVTVALTNGISPTTPGFAGSNLEEPSGFIGGGQIGYNWQFSPIWVVGLEADIQGADEKESNTLTSNFTGGGGSLTGSTVIDYQTKIDWFGTVRGRAGYVFGDGAVMTYVTGGLAYGKVDLGGTSTVSGQANVFPFPTFSTTRAIGHSHVNTGWTVGTGTEGKLLIPGWTYKIEYLYVDLGTLDDTDPLGIFISSVSGGQTITHTHFTDNILRVGLNYQFH